MPGQFRSLAEYLREAAGLTSDLFVEKYNHPVLLWSERDDWIEDTAFQFETFSSEIGEQEPRKTTLGTESQIAETLIIEIRKQDSPAPSNMICAGRAANNDIVFRNNTVSKLHCYFLKIAQSDSYEIVDANSTNGTMVNNTRLVAYQNHPLDNRDTIRIGPSIQLVYLTPRRFYELLQQLQRSGIV
jgi:pSer/pThr/pTyr-binding forkhead associated (FHA) protein